MKRPICKYFLEGHCRFGDKCRNHHPQQNPNIQNPIAPQNPQINPNDQDNCRNFLQGNCNRNNCPFFHGYGNKLKHLKKTDAHDLLINDMCYDMDHKLLLTSDKSCIKMWRFNGDNFELFKAKKIDGYEITKLTYSGKKIILILEKDEM